MKPKYQKKGNGLIIRIPIDDSELAQTAFNDFSSFLWAYSQYSTWFKQDEVTNNESLQVGTEFSNLEHKDGVDCCGPIDTFTYIYRVDSIASNEYKWTTSIKQNGQPKVTFASTMTIEHAAEEGKPFILIKESGRLMIGSFMEYVASSKYVCCIALLVWDKAWEDNRIMLREKVQDLNDYFNNYSTESRITFNI